MTLRSKSFVQIADCQGFSIGDFDGGGNMDFVPRHKGEMAFLATLAQVVDQFRWFLV